MVIVTAECIADTANELGEGPIWCSRSDSLYWVDCVQKRIHCLDARTGRLRHWEMPGFIGSIGLRQRGGLVVALRGGLHFFEDGPGLQERLSADAIDFSRERLNDGKVDRAGRFWVGAFDRRLTPASGGLYVLDADRSISRKDSGITMANGIAWSIDDQTMYFCDSPPGIIYAYDFDLARGDVRNRRIFLDLTKEPYLPDGCTVDAENFLWVAQPHAHRVARYDRTARLCGIVTVPEANPSSVIFGGSDLATLYITTMRFGAPIGQVTANPKSGGIYAAVPGVVGLPEPQFAG